LSSGEIISNLNLFKLFKQKKMVTIILNPEETQRLDYEQNWKNLVSFDHYLLIKAQRAVFKSNEKGLQPYSNR